MPRITRREFLRTSAAAAAAAGPLAPAFVQVYNHLLELLYIGNDPVEQLTQIFARRQPAHLDVKHRGHRAAAADLGRVVRRASRDLAGRKTDRL